MNHFYQELLDYWFDNDSDLPTKNEMRKWFLKSRLYDGIITQKFLDLYKKENERIVYCGYIPTSKSKEEALGRIILLDQIPRHIFRGTAEQYVFEKDLADYVYKNIGELDGLPLKYKLFFLMPLQHSENIEDQKSYKLIWDNIEEEHPRNRIKEYLNFFQKIGKNGSNHRNIIETFGRFPKRNQILGRQNSSEEEKYLQSNIRGFY